MFHGSQQFWTLSAILRRTHQLGTQTGQHTLTMEHHSMQRFGGLIAPSDVLGRLSGSERLLVFGIQTFRIRKPGLRVLRM